MAGLYIHIPYCHSKCAYCDFYSTPRLTQMSELAECIVTEYDLRRSEASPIDTIYIGGGTPSILDIDTLGRMVSELVRCIGNPELREFTIEANPEDICADKVRVWHELGISRVSMGVQSLVDSELRAIGRRHNSQQAIDAVNTLRMCGIDNLSLDLIYGLPGQTLESWAESLECVLGLEPQHLSAYMLSYEPHTRLSVQLDRGLIQPVAEDQVIEMYAMLTHRTAQAGYQHYEISNFAQQGYIAVHNSNYWNGTPYIGLGPSAHSYDGKTRRVNPNNIREYIKAIKSGIVAYDEEVESRVDVFNNQLITAMRTSKGLDFGSVKVMRRQKLLTDAFPYIQRGDIIVQDNHLIIPEDRWLISDAIFRDLMQVR